MNLILFLGILLVLGLASTRLMKILKLPNVTGYLIVGLLAAVICILIDNYSSLNLENDLSLLNNFTSSIALGFIALSIGQEFKLSKVKEYGSKIISITLLQALTAVLFVDVTLIIVCILTNQSLAIALCLGAIATATAPAATIMVINQYKAKGPLVDILLPVVAFDDAVGLIVFAISIAISKVIVTGGEITFFSICALPLIEVFGSLVIGIVLGLLMYLVVRFFKSRDNHAIILIAFTLLGVGACDALNQIVINGEALEFSNLLCCMMIGAVYINLPKGEKRDIAERDFTLINHWTPFLFMLFFVLSGTHLATSVKELFQNGSENNISFTIVTVMFICYLIMRSLGKYVGSFVGCKLTHQRKTITTHLGITLLPQAGVAIGMANQISNMDAFKVAGIGNAIVTVVLCATLIYELVGPLLTKWSLSNAGEIPDENGNYPYLNNQD